MRISLNVEESVKRELVVNDRQDSDTKFNKYFNVFFRVVFVGLFLLGFPIFLWVGIYTGRLTSFSNIIFPGLIFCIGLISLYGILLGDKFIRFRGGQDLNKNRDIVLRLFKEYYPKNNFFNGGHFMTSYLKPTGFMKCKKPTNRILVIFDHNDILINISVFSDAGVQSPFHTIFHHWTINRIKSRLTDEIKGRR
jgi:hypothetical protein